MISRVFNIPELNFRALDFVFFAAVIFGLYAMRRLIAPGLGRQHVAVVSTRANRSVNLQRVQND
ncbi:MAG: hypothetical protein ACJAYS_000625 [Lentimonas sp.]